MYDAPVTDLNFMAEIVMVISVHSSLVCVHTLFMHSVFGCPPGRSCQADLEYKSAENSAKINLEHQINLSGHHILLLCTLFTKVDSIDQTSGCMFCAA